MQIVNQRLAHVYLCALWGIAGFQQGMCRPQTEPVPRIPKGTQKVHSFTFFVSIFLVLNFPGEKIHISLVNLYFTGVFILSF